MSPRRIDPETRSTLLEIAGKLLAEEGPGSLSVRRIAACAGTSTMPIYTHFGGMNGLVREIVHEGFARMQSYFNMVRATDDPVMDMALLGRTYRHNAIVNPHLYTVMFGSAALTGFSLSEEERQHGRYTLERVIECAAQCIDAGRFNAADPALVAHQMWIATHGAVILELGGYLIPPYDAQLCFESQLTSLMVGVGDSPAAAERSVRRSLPRLQNELLIRDTRMIPDEAHLPA